MSFCCYYNFAAYLMKNLLIHFVISPYHRPRIGMLLAQGVPTVIGMARPMLKQIGVRYRLEHWVGLGGLRPGLTKIFVTFFSIKVQTGLARLSILSLLSRPGFSFLNFYLFIELDRVGLIIYLIGPCYANYSHIPGPSKKISEFLGPWAESGLM